jgi:hypothetical protein
MAIRYSDRPQLQYGSGNGQSFEQYWAERFPPHAQPIATAPEHSGSPVYIYEPSGECHVAMYKSNRGWLKMEPRKDEYTGATHWRLTDERIAQPVLWASS